MPVGVPVLSSVGDDFAVFHMPLEVGATTRIVHDLKPSSEYTIDGVTFTTLGRPAGELLSVFATANDVHFGETQCGVVGGTDIGPVHSAEPGDRPYPEVMNEAAIAEMKELRDGRGPDHVVVKGDLTNAGTPDEYETFLRFYGAAFGDRLTHVRGNHDAYEGQHLAPQGPQRVDLAGVTVCLLDTTIPRKASGQVPAEQLEWLDTVASDSRVPVLAMGHHPVWNLGGVKRSADYFGINPDDSESLAEVINRRPIIGGYFAGHTHRNRVRRFPVTGDFRWVEVASVKDFPGAWAEYRVYESGIQQIFHRVSDPTALVWTEKTKNMYHGIYEDYALGKITDRCFVISTAAPK